MLPFVELCVLTQYYWFLSGFINNAHTKTAAVYWLRSIRLCGGGSSDRTCVIQFVVVDRTMPSLLVLLPVLVATNRCYPSNIARTVLVIFSIFCDLGLFSLFVQKTKPPNFRSPYYKFHHQKKALTQKNKRSPEKTKK